VLALLASPDATGLFGRAIAQSPALPLIADYDTRAEQAQRFLHEVGVRPAELKALPQRELGRAARRVQMQSVATTPTLAHGPTYGVDLLPRHPIEAARAGQIAAIPLIIGTNSHEASMFAWSKPAMLPTTVANVDTYFARVADSDTAGTAVKDRVLAAYPGYPRRRALVTIGSDAMFGAPCWAFADAYSALAPTFVYRFDHTTWTLRALGLGATHGSEIVHIQHSYSSYLGRKLHPLGRHVQPSVGRRMQRSWLDFVGAEPNPDWPPYGVPQRATRIIRTSRDVTVNDPDTLRRSAWSGVY
jgi:para-nitrobenzyl esterase